MSPPLRIDAHEPTLKNYVFWLPGGSYIPYDVDAQLNLEKPVRSITLQWKEPRNKLASSSHYSYEVVICPQTGKHKTVAVKNCQITIDYLKSATTYTFEVYSVYIEERVEKKSLAAKSNSVTTNASKKKALNVCLVFVLINF